MSNFKTGTIADVGYDDYKGKQTFYLVLQNEKGENAEPIRGKGLEEAFNKVGDLKKGDTVNLKDFGIDETTKKRMWEIERHEPYQDLQNSISQDKERTVAKEKSPDEVVQEAQNAWQGKTERKPEEFENLPSSIKNNYYAITKNRFLQDEKVNYYDKDDKDQVNIAFEDRKDSLNTSRQDEKTINAMLDMAESKNWTKIQLKGTEEFKQKAWLEASLRGIETKGYTPSEKDQAELIAKQKERTQNTVIAEEVKITDTTPQGEAKDNKDKLDPKEIAKEIPPVRPIVAGAFVAKDTKGTDDKLQEKSALQIKADIRQITQNGYKNGTISNRDDLVKHLSELGYTIKENDKSIVVTPQDSTQKVKLTNEMFTKDYDALKDIKAKLEPQAMQQQYPKLSDENIAKAVLWKEIILDRYETPQAQQKALHNLHSTLPDVASGKKELPPIPQNEIKPDIEVRTPDNGEQSRSR
ncbi:LPD7 domain-containing protein [Moraxella nonliquefaciens]|jgi:primase C 2 (priCT-2) superfamily|uniref:Large polyvalent protein-associated domain-containing protein n=1 Tax=Moraxella nonliquefaciens TaxID=478 RepID=A0A1B8QHY8_MORNO|nr:LPD7 domain-containing protein [Moraxella nonliquefaciens]OBX82980.1 hypothetical protein A7456_06130 [Moraxella nonliquefaciens]QPT43580.1 hypothetical protein I6G26_00375 [Moraxella nonliquefaciens]QPT43625.1 hypothetical protein I6G26_00140 [Moraxella nonliquefaciens]QQC28837.1 hypothetical protein I6H63_00025 [Moraxella nonliquefaciens]